MIDAHDNKQCSQSDSDTVFEQLCLQTQPDPVIPEITPVQQSRDSGTCAKIDTTEPNILPTTAHEPVSSDEEPVTAKLNPRKPNPTKDDTQSQTFAFSGTPSGRGKQQVTVTKNSTGNSRSVGSQNNTGGRSERNSQQREQREQPPKKTAPANGKKGQRVN